MRDQCRGRKHHLYHVGLVFCLLGPDFMTGTSWSNVVDDALGFCRRHVSASLGALDDHGVESHCNVDASSRIMQGLLEQGAVNRKYFVTKK